MWSGDVSVQKHQTQHKYCSYLVQLWFLFLSLDRWPDFLGLWSQLCDPGTCGGAFKGLLLYIEKLYNDENLLLEAT